MDKSSTGETIVITVLVNDQYKHDFVNWQTKLNANIASFQGFISLEILSTVRHTQPVWTIVERFSNSGTSKIWQESTVNRELMNELRQLLGQDAVQQKLEVTDWRQGVTEVFVTKISSNKEDSFRDWLAKIHRVEAGFPGFRGMYVQSPTEEKGQNWLTFLHFDTVEHLDNWLSSPERKKVLDESKPLIASLESHRIISPYAGWFASIEKEGSIPSVWKQTMLVLLVLFPIVMFELKFLTPLTGHLNHSLGTFIGNAISVILISWPMMPIAIMLLGWWLADDSKRFSRVNILGTVFIFFLYLLEIIFFWNFL